MRKLRIRIRILLLYSPASPNVETTVVGSWKPCKHGHVAPDAALTCTAHHSHHQSGQLPHPDPNTSSQPHPAAILILILTFRLPRSSSASFVIPTHSSRIPLSAYVCTRLCLRLTNHKSLTTEEAWHFTAPVACRTPDTVLATHSLRDHRLCWFHDRCHPRRLRNTRRRSLTPTRADHRRRYKQTRSVSVARWKVEGGVCTVPEVYLSQDRA